MFADFIIVWCGWGGMHIDAAVCWSCISVWAIVNVTLVTEEVPVLIIIL